MRVNAGAGDATGADFASAFLAVIQARFRVQAVVRAEARILKRREQGETLDLDPADRGEDLAIFREGFEVYRACWPEPVRRYFDELTGETYVAFADALTVLGEALYEGAARPGPVVSMITPEAFRHE
jgi:hypothetical protein